jgi:hypothetical protein
MRDVVGTAEAGVFAEWTWIGEDDPQHRFTTSVKFLYDVMGEHEGYLASVSAR